MNAIKNCEHCVKNRSKKWAINTRRLDLMKKDAKYLNGNIRICSDHFEPEMFEKSSKKTLTRNATPTLFNIPNPPPRVGQKRRLLHREETKTIHSKYIFTCTATTKQNLELYYFLLKNVNLNNLSVLPLTITVCQTT